MVLLTDGLKRAFDGRPVSDTKASKLQVPTTFTFSAKLALSNAVWMLAAAPAAKGWNWSA